MTINYYQVGDAVDIDTATPFTTKAGTPFDPTTVTFSVIDPAGTQTDYVYGTDSEVTKNGTGDYTCSIDVDTPGTWLYRIFGDSTGNRGADEGYFIVRPSEFS